MVTRNIKANTATQVNANLIGVQVRPDVVPPTYEVSELTANVQVNEVECTNMMNGLPMLYVNFGSGDEIWGYTGNQEEYNGTVYNVWSCIMGNNPETYYTDSNVDITDETEFYEYDSNPDHPPMKSIGNSQYMLSYSGVLYRFDPNDYPYAPESEDTYDLAAGFVLDKDSGQYVGKVVSDSLGNKEFACTYEAEEGGYTYWKLDYKVKIYLFSTVRNPEVGYNLISNNAGTELYTSPVLTVTEKEVDPGYTKDVDCALSYSVDGETWTEWPDHMTDANNVISNIPRYMYLKFSQDVVITEE